MLFAAVSWTASSQGAPQKASNPIIQPVTPQKSDSRISAIIIRPPAGLWPM